MSPRPVLVAVCGHPATGKTTIARRLGSALDAPVLCKDDVKEVLADQLGCTTPERSHELGRAATFVLYLHAAEVLGRGLPVVVESNFPAEVAAQELGTVIDRTGAAAVRVVCSAEADEALRRFEERARAGRRHPCHFDLEILDELRTRLATPYRVPELPGPLFSVDAATPGLDRVIDAVQRLRSGV